MKLRGVSPYFHSLHFLAVLMDDLDAAAGGYYAEGAAVVNSIMVGHSQDDDTNNCDRYDRRQIYGGGGFPNCAATVEDGSWCKSSDACVNFAVDYKGMTNCKKAWR